MTEIKDDIWSATELGKALDLKSKLADLLGRMQKYANDDGPFIDRDEYLKFKKSMATLQEWQGYTDDGWLSLLRRIMKGPYDEWNGEWKRFNPDMSGVPFIASGQTWFRIPFEEKPSTWEMKWEMKWADNYVSIDRG